LKFCNPERYAELVMALIPRRFVWGSFLAGNAGHSGTINTSQHRHKLASPIAQFLPISEYHTVSMLESKPGPPESPE
jgi:hypothetical protein